MVVTWTIDPHPPPCPKYLVYGWIVKKMFVRGEVILKVYDEITMVKRTFDRTVTTNLWRIDFFVIIIFMNTIVPIVEKSATLSL